MRIIFAGTPEFAVPALERLVETGAEVAAVYTQPDRRAGRGRRSKQSPVKIAADRHALPVAQPVSLSDEGVCRGLRALEPQVMVVVAYGLILPREVLRIPTFGCVNVHASLLPRWRGAAPVARAIEAGDTTSGVSIMEMDQGLDTGPIIATRETAIELEDNAATLQRKLALLGADLLVDKLPAYVRGEITVRKQDDTGVTYAPKLTVAEARVDWQRPAVTILNQIRAFNPWPVSYTFYGESRIRILAAEILAERPQQQLPAGSLLAFGREGIDVACGKGILRLLRLQRDGGKPLPAGAFLNGFPLDRTGRFQ